MKIDKRRLYTHPVLADGRDDYKTCKFTAETDWHFDAADNLALKVKLSTDCPEINRLISNGDAEYLLHAENPLASYRKTFSSVTGNFFCVIERNRLKQSLELLALVVLKKDMSDFFCGDWNEDFSGLKFTLPKGSVLAYQNFRPLIIPDDMNVFKNVASIFIVYKRVVDAPETFFEVNLSDDKIRIGLNAAEYLRYRQYGANPTMQPILNAMIILPALVYVFEELKQSNSFELYGTKGWFLSLKAAYRRQKINFEEYLLLPENMSIRLAQEIMNAPLTKALENVSLICNAEDS